MKRKTCTILAVLLVTTFMFSGCTQSKTEKEVSKDAKDAGAVNKSVEFIQAKKPEKTPQVARDRKDTLIVAGIPPQGQYNPLYSSDVASGSIIGLIFESLISMDSEGKLIPFLAKEWKVSEDQRTYTFTLNKGIKFSNGDELTAEDIEFTYTAMCDPSYDGFLTDYVRNLVGFEEYNKGNATSVAGIKVIDPYTISFTEKETRAPAIYDFGVGIISKEYYGFQKGNAKKLKDLFGQPMGTGPYIFKYEKPGQETVLESNTNYWRGSPKIKNIIIKAVNPTTALQELISGNVDLGGIQTDPEYIKMAGNAGFLNTYMYDASGYSYIALNLRNDMFKDKKVRQALMYGLNRQGYIDAAFKGYARISNEPMPACSWAYTEEGINTYAYDKEKANKLLDEAGWIKKEDGFRYKDGKKFTVHLLCLSGINYFELLAVIAKENWKELGVELVPEFMEQSTVINKVIGEQKFEMVTFQVGVPPEPDPSALYLSKNTAPGKLNFIGWENAETDEIIEEALKTTDIVKRTELYHRFLKITNNEVIFLFLSTNKQTFVVGSRVKNINIGANVGWFTNIHLAELSDK